MSPLGVLLISLSANALAQELLVPRQFLPGGVGPLATVDIDGDGDLDVLAQDPLLLINDGTGALQDETSRRLPAPRAIGLAIGDFDRDGDPDVILGPLMARASFFANDGRGYFRDETAARLPAFGGSATRVLGGIAPADIDGDGDLDLVLGSMDQGPLNSAVWINDGKGVFADETQRRLPTLVDLVGDVKAGDVDGDGDVDIVFGVGGRAVEIGINDGTGVFAIVRGALPLPSQGTGDLVLADLDGDGDLDVFVTGGTVGDRLYANDGKGRFTDVSSRLPTIPNYRGSYGAMTIDADRDGRPDLVVASVDAGKPQVLLADGNGGFRWYPGALVDRPAQTSPWYFIGGDLDGDGDDDLVERVMSAWPPLFPAGLWVDVNLERQLLVPAAPTVGGSYRLDLYARRPPVIFWPFVAPVTANLPVPGLGTLRVDPATMVAIGSWPLLASQRVVSLAIPVPNDAALRGVPLAAQALVWDVNQSRVDRLTNAFFTRIE